jgi:phage anti-repressor protein
VKTVNARDLHAFLEVGKDFATWIKSRIEQYGFAHGLDFEPFEAGPQNGGAGNRGIRIEYAITTDMAKELCMVERNEKGRQARLYFIDCERRAAAQPLVELSRLDILRLAMAAEEAKLQAEAARDEAIRTKALIGSKREATAMATASAAKREASKLRDALGVNTRHATVIAVQRATGTKHDWAPLRRWCRANGLDGVDVPDDRYGTAKAWPAAAWMAVHCVDLSALFGEVMA